MSVRILAETELRRVVALDPAAVDTVEAGVQALAAGRVAAEASFPELGDVVAGRAPRRGAPEDIAIADMTGTGVQDTVIATLARRRAEAAGAGTNLET